MFIRSITTTAIMLAGSAAHAQAGNPIADPPSRNTLNARSHFGSAEPSPHAQQPDASLQRSAAEERSQAGRGFSQRPEEAFPQFSASLPPLGLYREADIDPAVTRYYDPASDVPAHVAPPIFYPQTQSYTEPDQHRDPPFGAITYKELPAKADPFSPGYAASPSLTTPFPGDHRAWSCIAINGRECAPSLHQAAFAFGPARV
ncbi:hypothetical protein HS961_12455 [Comamonas piscis]|uniref:Uncharacterized protein n=1 Tax=Comamonas piscis TaxID=1562974 RepID=A0A7G5EHU6_9BURK|nr:hypothetical protein [Comamonas piscis]QMV73571.1 hypothetical protein HS961_12455 [Comamonas piscis]WSO31992.1 hypothetical protein VUJ63_12490 [Comamonas piscis]